MVFIILATAIMITGYVRRLGLAEDFTRFLNMGRRAIGMQLLSLALCKPV